MLDAQLIFDGTLSPAAGVAITNSRVSTNVIDLLVARDVGAGNELGIFCGVMTAFTTTNSATLQVDFEVSADNSTYYALMFSAVIPAAQLIAGEQIARFVVPVNQVLNAAAGILKAPGRYIRLSYTVGTGVFSAGSVFSYLAPAEDRNVLYTYPSNYVAATTAAEI